MKTKQKTRKLKLLVSKLINDFPVGSHRSLLKNWGGDFDSVRPWQAGDRRVAMAATARTGEVMAKVYQEPKRMSVWSLVDTSLSMNFGFDNNCAEAAAVLTMVLSHSVKRVCDLIGAVFFDSRVRGLVNPQAAIDAKIISKMASGDSLPRPTNIKLALEELLKFSPTNGLIVILSDFYFSFDGDTVNLLKQVEAGNNTILAVVLANKNLLPDQNQPFLIDFQDAESGEVISWNLNDSRSRTTLLQEYDSWQKELRVKLRQANCEVIFTDIQGNYVRDLARHFSRKKHYEV